jgi:hypothetical protein
MDYLKLIATGLSPVIALYAILFTYRKKVRSGDPNTEREVLTTGGRLALVLVLAAGALSVGAEFESQRRRASEQDRDRQELIQRLDRAVKQQEALNRAVSDLLGRIETALPATEPPVPARSPQRR